MFFFKTLYFQAAQIPKFFNSFTRTFNYYKIKCGECLYIAHDLRVIVVNCDINFLRIGPVKKFDINSSYK